MMKYGEFSLSILVPAPRQAVFAHLADLHNHKETHPLIIQVESIDAPVSHHNQCDHWYQITDRIRLLGIPFQIRYTACTKADPGKFEIYSEAHQNSGVLLKNTMTLTETDGGTQVEEHVTIAAPRLLFGFSIQQAKASHKTSLDSLKTLFIQK